MHHTSQVPVGKMAASTTRKMVISLHLYFALLLPFVFMKNIHGTVILEAPVDEIDAKVITKEYFLLIFCDEPKSLACQEQIEDAQELFDEGMAASFTGLEAIMTSDEMIRDKYGVVDVPVIAFFRGGVPIFFMGEGFEELTLDEWMSTNREIRATALTDSNFEHDTQAATGATTGDWFVMFYAQECVQHLGTWEVIASWLSKQKVIGKMDISQNPLTKERFGLTKCPTLIMFSKGKMYTYEGPVSKLRNIASFGRGVFLQQKAVPVPKAPTVFDNIQVSFLASIFGCMFGSCLTVTGAAVLVFIIIIVILKKRSKRRAKFD